MKIVINGFSARLGGGQTYLCNLLAHMPEKMQLEVFVYAPEGLDLPCHPSVKRVQTRWPTANPILRTLWERFVLPKILLNEHADVLFCPGGVVVTAPPVGCKVVTMFRNMIPFDPRVRKSVPWGMQRLRNFILRWVMIKSMANADLTIFISDYARGVIEKITSIKKPVTIPHGIGSVFRCIEQALDRPAFRFQESYLLYVSRFDVYKHHYEVVSAYANLPQKFRERFPLILVGEAEMPEANRVRHLVENLNLTDYVQFLGAIPYFELPAVYQYAHMVIFASSCENCPNILLEALGSGRPIISSDVMPMPEFGGDAVAYFSPFDSDDIYKTMLKVLADDEYAKSLVQAAARRSCQYDWKTTADRTWLEIVQLAETEC